MAGETQMAGLISGGAGAVDTNKQQLDTIKQLLMRQLQPQAHPAQPTTRPGYGPDETKQKGYMMGDQGSNKAEIGAAMSNFGTFVSNMVAQHKQNQVRDAAGVWSNLARAQENAMAVIGPPPNGNPSDPEYVKKVVDIMSKDPWVASNLNPANPKAMKHLKNMQKAFDVNLLGGEGDQDNVYREGLKRHFQIKQALQRVVGARGKMDEHKQKQQISPEQQKQAMSSVLGQFIGQGQVQGADPKNLEAAARIQEAEEARKEREQIQRETLEYHKQAHLDQLGMQKESLAMRKQQMEQTYDSRKATLEESTRHHKEMEALTSELRRIEWDRNNTLNDVSGLKDSVDRGMPITQITDSKSRDAVIKAFAKEGRRVPQPINNAEQTALDDGATQIAKTRSWQAALTEQYGENLPNKPGATTWDRIKYKFGAAPPDAALISDFSRERWAAIGGLVRGVRRGDILRDMIQHTPNPYIDSPKLMDVKLKALEANYSLARAVVYKEHGLQYDPTTGTNLDDDIKGYETHLKTAKQDISNMNAPKKVPKGAAPED